MRVLSIMLAAWLAIASPVGACTTMFQSTSAVFAYNYDFDTGVGHVLVNKRGMRKVAAVDKNPARWESRFGSITFVQFGRDNPMTGMNEAGLTVSQMWLDETRYEAVDDRPAIGVLEWMQYLLDTSANVAEALDRAGAVRIESSVPLHYALADETGDVAMVEFLEGRLTVHRGAGLPHAVMTNSTYAQSLSNVSAAQPGSTGISSLARFARAAEALRQSPADPVQHAFATLADVAQPGRTRWSIVYDLRARTVAWRSQDNAALRRLDMARLDLTCRTPMLAADLHGGQDGDATPLLADYDPEANADLVVRAYAETPFLSRADPNMLRQEAARADNATCGE